MWKADSTAHKHQWNFHAENDRPTTKNSEGKRKRKKIVKTHNNINDIENWSLSDGFSVELFVLMHAFTEIMPKSFSDRKHEIERICVCLCEAKVSNNQRKEMRECWKLFVLIDFKVIKVSRVAFHIPNDHLTKMRPLQRMRPHKTNPPLFLSLLLPLSLSLALSFHSKNMNWKVFHFSTKS